MRHSIEPVTGWLCLACGKQTSGTLDEPDPCCPDQFALRAGFLHPDADRPTGEADAA